MTCKVDIAKKGVCIDDNGNLRFYFTDDRGVINASDLLVIGAKAHRRLKFDQDELGKVTVTEQYDLLTDLGLDR
jgi:hypothetical protein